MSAKPPKRSAAAPQALDGGGAMGPHPEFESDAILVLFDDLIKTNLHKRLISFLNNLSWEVCGTTLFSEDAYNLQLQRQLLDKNSSAQQSYERRHQQH